jgi:DNA sulfur modification protein DndD
MSMTQTKSASKVFLEELKMKNWAQFDEQIIKFCIDPQKNITYILGKNGSGKTTVFDAIFTALFGYLINKDRNLKTYINKEALSNNEEKPVMELTIDFKVEKSNKDFEKYKVKRTWMISGDSENPIIESSKNVFQKWVNTSYRPISEEEYTKKINNIIPIAAREFYFLDGEHIRTIFENATTKQIKKLSLQMSDYLNIDIIT